MKSFYESWGEAVKDAGFPDLLFHDLRRSAVRNMVEKIGMSEKRAMEISGHKTRSCFEPYHIVSLADIQETGQKMDMWIKAQRSKRDGSSTGKRKEKPQRRTKGNLDPSTIPLRQPSLHEMDIRTPVRNTRGTLSADLTARFFRAHAQRPPGFSPQ
jgi:hypothetical protein